MDHVPLIGVHGLQGDIPAVFDHLARRFAGQAVEGFLPAGAVALGVHVDAHPMAAALVHRVAGELLDGVQGLPPVADKGAHILPLQHHLVRIPLPGDHGDSLHPHVLEQPGLEADDGGGHIAVCPLPFGSGIRIGLGRGPVHPGGGLGFGLRFGGGALRAGGLGLFRPGGGGGPGLGCGLRLGDGGLLVRGLVGELHLGGHGADAQKAGLAPLQDLHGHVVPVQAQIGQPLGDGLVLGLGGEFHVFQHETALLLFFNQEFDLFCPPPWGKRTAKNVRLSDT